MMAGDNFDWRHNDNSVLTRLRYDLETNHWLNAYQRKINSQAVSTGGGLEFIYHLFMVISGLLTVAFFVAYIIVKLLIYSLSALVRKVKKY